MMLHVYFSYFSLFKCYKLEASNFAIKVYFLLRNAPEKIVTFKPLKRSISAGPNIYATISRPALNRFEGQNRKYKHIQNIY